jgi:Holliday junction resolvasome RuvABC endonuclease subunit
MIVAGIDPGLSGAVAILDHDGSLLCVFDIPTVEEAHGKGMRSRVSPALLQDELIGDVKVGVAFIEHVASSPQMGVTSAFRFGEAFGATLAVLQCLGIKTELVRPQTWKKALGLNSEAEVSRARAIEQWPDSSHYFKRKLDHNRAEAALIAEYGRRMVR